MSLGAAMLIAAMGVGAAVYALTLDSSEKKSAAHSEVTHSHSHEDDDKKAALSTTEEAAAVIVYSDNGFEQPTYTVKSGETVLVKNNSSVDFYFTTGPHENHDIRSPLNLGTISPGKASSFVAPAAGVYIFHNHDNDAQAGELIVQ